MGTYKNAILTKSLWSRTSILEVVKKSVMVINIKFYLSCEIIYIK